MCSSRQKNCGNSKLQPPRFRCRARVIQRSCRNWLGDKSRLVTGGLWMKTLLSLAALGMLAGPMAIAQSDNAAFGSLQDHFAGAQRLASLEEPDAAGKLLKADCAGLLIFTPDGHISVQVMYRNPTTDYRGRRRASSQGLHPKGSSTDRGVGNLKSFSRSVTQQHSRNRKDTRIVGGDRGSSPDASAVTGQQRRAT